jgi:hypothetical protein
VTPTLQWGRSEYSKRVHLVINGKRQCIVGNGKPGPIVDVFPAWNPEDPLTCHKCKERYFWLMKGAIPFEPIEFIKT